MNIYEKKASKSQSKTWTSQQITNATFSTNRKLGLLSQVPNPTQALEISDQIIYKSDVSSHDT